MKTYKIKPLEWIKRRRTGEFEQYETRVPFGAFYVTRWWDSVNGKWLGWELMFQFDDWDDHHTVSVPSLKAGKDAATAEWHKRLSGALEEVT